ncbi:RNA-directed DNA polymerase, eukaryota, reverse transcriptase zinc-binding domain protein [Tanacetum coccineum]
MLSKWLWRFHTEENALWCKVICSIHGPSCGMYHSSSRPLSSGPWSHICNLKNDLRNLGIELPRLFKKKAGNGRNTSFRHYNWISGATFQDSFGDYIVLKQRRVVWTLQETSLSKSMRNHINHVSNPSTSLPIWNKFLPAKVNILLWRIMNKRVPTRVHLDKRGIDLDSVRCPLCDDDIETKDHVFALCSIAKDVWKEVMAWCKVSGVLVTSVDDAALLSDRVLILPKLKKPFDVAVNTTLWHL